MAKISLAGFKDPVRRPRYIIWTGVAVLVLAAVMIVALGVTSTRWFCSEGCHKVQDDSIIAYQRSTHSEISCMACHMPPNADPITFILHKAEALGELYLTVTDNFELPLNGDSHISLTMGSNQCTQCHNMDNRIVTPSPGIKMDHEVHAEINAACTVCHNRVGHREDFELTLNNPESKGGEPNRKHQDFMKMTACFRCHSLADDAAAPGACAKCHTPEFNLKPDNHDGKDFLPKGHAEMARDAQAVVEAAAKGHEEDGEHGEEGGSEAHESEETSFLGTEKAYASSGGALEPVALDQVPEIVAAQRSHGSDPKASIGPNLPKVESVNYCDTCHKPSFCDGCHGVAMPHPAEFLEPKDPKDPKGHPALSADKKLAEKCVMCHGDNAKTFFCDGCHHGTAVDHEFDKKTPWIKQHPKPVATAGVKACTERCHTTKFCVDCHTGENVVPSSHKDAKWTRNKPTVTVFGKSPAKASATHAAEATKSMESCEVCHGPGGTESKFCKSCHELEIPHSAEFKKNHVSSKKNSSACENCHSWKELCSNCHHIDSSFSKSWLSVHGGSVNKNGSEGCLKCHGGDSGTDTKFCVDCHQDEKVVPASHKADKFTRDRRTSKSAGHVELFEKDPKLCTFCHEGDAAKLPTSKFCNNCHKLTMPHPDGFGAKGKGNGGEHQKLFQEKKTSKSVCENCHTEQFCDSCHHEGTSTKEPWVFYHPSVVKKDGAQPCFDCHEETYCSACHVNLAKRGLVR